MRRSVLMLASVAALAAVPATAESRPPDPHCDPMACPDPVAMVQECLRTASLTADPNTGLPVIACSLR